MVLCFKVIGEYDVYCRVHDACVTSEVFTSHKCDCSIQLHAAMRLLSVKGGLLIYTPQEGRGSGILKKVEAYSWQTCDGFDTMKADALVDTAIESRTYTAVKYILDDLGVKSIRMLTNSMYKLECMTKVGVHYSREKLPTSSYWTASDSYLKHKNMHMRHDIDVRSFGLQKMQCLDHIRSALNHIHGRLAVVVSFATSINGVYCARDGSPLKISNQDTWEIVHHIRAMADHILVGATTWRNDKPRLRSNVCMDADPVRVILSRKRDIPLPDDDARTLLMTSTQNDDLTVPANVVHFDGSVEDCLRQLRQRQCRVLMIEGGQKVLRQFLPHADLVVWTQRLAIMEGRQFCMSDIDLEHHKTFSFHDNNVICCAPALSVCQECATINDA